MNIQQLNKNRYLLLVVIVSVSFGLVGAAVAAAGQAGRSVTEAVSPPPQSQGGAQVGKSHSPSSVQAAYELPVVQSLPDPLMEQMRLQAMTASRGLQQQGQGISTIMAGDVQVGEVGASMAPNVPAGDYIPDGIVVDTYLDYIYGYTTPYELVTVTRTDGAYGSAEADQTGFFFTPLYDGAFGGTPVDIAPGDVLTINGGSVTVGQQPGGYLLVVIETLVGNIAGDTGGTQVTVRLGAYGQPSSAYGVYTGMTDVNGEFAIVFDKDLGAENFAIVDYMVDGIYQRSYLFPDRTVFVQQHGMISGYAEPGSVITATVYRFDNNEIRWGPTTMYVDSLFGWFTFDGVELDFEQNNGDRIIVEFPNGPSEFQYVYASHFTFSGDDTVNGVLSHGNWDVRVSFLAWEDSGYVYTETHATSDVNGNFTAVFPEGGIRPDTRVDVAVMDGGPGSYMITGKPYVEAIIDQYSDNDCVLGRAEQPNQELTLELERNGEIFPRDLENYPLPPTDPGNRAGGEVCFLVWVDDQPMNFLPGDILRLSTPNSDPPWRGEVTIHEFHYTSDAIENAIDGNVYTPTLTSGEIAFRLSQAYYDFFPLDTGAEARSPVVDGSFYAMTDQFDIRSGTLMNDIYYDPVTGYSEQSSVRNHFFRTMGNQVVWGRTYISDEPITLRLLDPGTFEPIYTSTNDINDDPNVFYFDFLDCDPVCAPNPPLQPGVIVEVEYGYSGEGDWWLTYQPISVDGDVENNKVVGSGYAGMVDLYGGYDQISFDGMVPSSGSNAVLDTGSHGYDLGWGDSVNMVFQTSDGNRQVATKMLGEIRRMEFWFNPTGQTWMWGTAQPGSQVNIKTSTGETFTAWTDALDGYFNVNEAAMLMQGDIVTATAGDGMYPVTITIPDITVSGDSISDLVSGNIGLPNWSVEIHPWWNEPMTTTTTYDIGDFMVHFGDVPPQGSGYIRYIQEFGDANADVIFHKPFYDIINYIMLPIAQRAP